MHRYENVPAVLYVTLALFPGAMLGVAHEPSFAAASCVLVSLLTHMTVDPREIVAGFGLNAVDESTLAPATIEMVVVVGVGLGFEGLVELELLPHALHTQIIKATKKVRADIASIPPGHDVAIQRPPRSGVFGRKFTGESNGRLTNALRSLPDA